MGTMSYKIADTAYLTIIMHLAKYPSAVSGVLLGKASPSGEISIEKALPIAHSSLAIGTTPTTEMALLIAEQEAVKSDQRIVGAYFGNEIADDTSIGTFPTRIADRIHSHFSNACLLMISPPGLAPDVRRKEHCFRLCVRSSEQHGTWAKGTRPKTDLKVSGTALSIGDGLLSGKASVFDVADFEDHCLDPRQDWFNNGIESKWSHLQTAL